MKTIQITQSGDYTIALTQEGDSVEVVGRLKAQGNEKIIINLVVIHQAKHTQANISMKATVDHAAQVTINGSVIVETIADDTNSFLEERILLLSPQAKAEVIPNLEIKTNNVKCSHAATIGQFNEDQLFYLTARGIDLVTAKQMLAEAFLSS